jgi:hypothetical protein
MDNVQKHDGCIETDTWTDSWIEVGTDGGHAKVTTSVMTLYGEVRLFGFVRWSRMENVHLCEDLKK